MYGTVNLLPLAPRLISFDFNSLLLLKYLMISKIREKLALYKPQDITASGQSGQVSSFPSLRQAMTCLSSSPKGLTQ